jgi:hypothetical protein
MCLTLWQNATYFVGNYVCRNVGNQLYVLLTVHLGSILVNNQLEAHFICIYLFQFSTCFEHSCAHHQENQLY